jgi:hypothetical protein
MYAPSVWMIMIVGALVVASNWPALRLSSSASAVEGDRPSLVAMNQEKSLLREGTSVSESRGRFQIVKERVIFSDETLGKSFTCLENLMLQRIHAMLGDDEGRRQRWLVTGKITEFNGENFLWLDRATRAR